jgi:hypothetical protein
MVDRFLAIDNMSNKPFLSTLTLRENAILPHKKWQKPKVFFGIMRQSTGLGFFFSKI